MNIKAFVLGALQTNCYVAYSASEAAIIDPAEYSEEIMGFINESRLTVRWIILTHAHYDHVGGAKSFKDSCGAVLAMSENDIPVLGSSGMLDSSYLENEIGFFISDGSQFEIGDEKLAAIHTPGHSPGSVSLYAQGLLFSGDTLFERSIGRTDLYLGSFSEIEKSIKKLYSLQGATIVYPGHGGTTTIGSEKLNNPFVRG
ncbi:MAG: MBL fold metallo-hydrolase [Eubacteriaceae bacterium]|nr:MBL fold metallo-hydrolase [Eubacteriaceae bacterium]